MFAATNACTLLGTEAVSVRVEAHVEKGLPRFTIIGMRESDGNSARERVRCGLLAVGVELPNNRVTVSIAPADLPKAGAAFDLPIAVALLGALGRVSAERIDSIAFQAELGLNGWLRPVLGAMASARVAAEAGRAAFVVAPGVARRAAHASIPVIPADSLADVVAHLTGQRVIQLALPEVERDTEADDIDLADVRGQLHAASALEIAAAGGHNMLMFGPPGCGKTMLASRLTTLLPPLDGDHALEVATIHDAAGFAREGVSRQRPFRAPHHHISANALVGGGSNRPLVGEISLAHHGVLFLDELPEFRPSAIDSLRQPIEDGCVTIRRSRWLVRYPARFQLVAAMNLCRCGNSGSLDVACRCTDQARSSYAQRVSGAVLDRIDLHVRLERPSESLLELPPAPTSGEVRERVTVAQQRQSHRWGPGVLNAHIRGALARRCRVDDDARCLLRDLASAQALAGRTQAAIIRTARTIADLRGSAAVESRDLVYSQSLCVPAQLLDQDRPHG